jgi:pimeloyl-ACP methyl ester carboxylesterase
VGWSTVTDELTRRRLLALSSAATGVAALGTAAVAAQGSHENYDDTIESHDGTEIAMTVYRPAGATADDPVPLILHSHGWSGSRTSDDGAFRRELDRGFGVLSFDQRGHGESGGQAWVQNPELEGRDVIEVLDYVEALEWVAPSKAGPGSMVFAMGGSYGGGYQLVGALTETWLDGETRFDALAPEITWYNLSESLAPDGVVRSAWVAALYAAGAANVPEHIHRGFVYGSSTGQWPTGDLPGEPNQDARFYRNGPSGFAETNLERGAYPGEEDFSDAFVEEEYELDVPVLFGQGMNDNLFTLDQAWRNFEDGLTDWARQRSAVVSYNGGHALPEVLPPGQVPSFQDGCSPGGDFGELRLRFFEHVRDNPQSVAADDREAGGARDLEALDGAYSLTKADGEGCVQVDALDDRTALATGVDLAVANDGEGNLEIERVEGAGDRTVAPGEGFPGEYDPEAVAAAFEGTGTDADGGSVATTTGAGTPVHLELASGPLTVAGVPELSAAVTTAGVEQRVFLALSVGESPATAQVVQNNMMPLREPEPVTGAERTVELPGVAVDVGEAQSLYLTVSAVSDMSFGHGSARTPGVVALEDLTVGVPLVD